MSHIVTAEADGVLSVEIRRPEKKNALTAAMYRALAETFARADADPGVRAVLLRGQADLFTAGNDLADFLARDGATDSPAMAFLARLSACRKPVVAAVGGHAVGIGTTLLLHCDLVYAADSARFRLPFVDLGLCPEGGSSLLLPRRIGALRAAAWLLLGEPFGAHEALAAGMVNAVVPEADLLAHAMARAVALASKPARSVQTTKALLRHAAGGQTEAVMAAEFAHFVRLLAEPEAQRIVAGLIEARGA